MKTIKTVITLTKSELKDIIGCSYNAGMYAVIDTIQNIYPKDIEELKYSSKYAKEVFESYKDRIVKHSKHTIP